MMTLGRYEVVAELGTGGMGKVYRGRDTVLEREVALKTIQTGPGMDAELRERFYREARSCAKLQHPSIVTIFDFGEQDGLAYIAMELLSGADLKKIISGKTQFPLEAKLDLAVQVCEGLGHAHRNGIVHRDVKPGNIFIHEGNWAKILDFGIARVAASRITRVGAALGTPDYMAPEQLSGKPCEARSDLFSAALVIFEFLTYVHPFFGANTAKRIANEAPRALREADPRMPASLEAALARGLAKDPAERFQTGEEFAAALRGVREELRLAVFEAHNSIGAMQEEMKAAHEELGDFERCARIRQIFEDTGSDFERLREWKAPAGAGYLEARDLAAELERWRRAQKKAAELARETKRLLAHAAGALERGDLEGCGRDLELVEAEFPDHPQLAELRAKAGPARGDAGADERVEALLVKLEGALEEEDRDAMTEWSQKLRLELAQEREEEAHESTAALAKRAGHDLLAADFSVAVARFTDLMAEGDLTNARKACQDLKQLELRDEEQLEIRDRCSQEFDEAASKDDPNERRSSDFLRLLAGFNNAVGAKDTAAAAEALAGMKQLLAVDEQFGVTVAACEKRMGDLALGPAPPDPLLVRLRRRSQQLLELDCGQCIAFIRGLSPAQQADPEIAAAKAKAVAAMEARERSRDKPSSRSMKAASRPKLEPLGVRLPASPFDPGRHGGRSAGAPQAPDPAKPVVDPPRTEPQPVEAAAKPPATSSRLCPKCHTGNPPAAPFCQSCGAALALEKPLPVKASEAKLRDAKSGNGGTGAAKAAWQPAGDEAQTAKNVEPAQQIQKELPFPVPGQTAAEPPAPPRATRAAAQSKSKAAGDRAAAASGGLPASAVTRLDAGAKEIASRYGGSHKSRMAGAAAAAVAGRVETNGAERPDGVHPPQSATAGNGAAPSERGDAANGTAMAAGAAKASESRLLFHQGRTEGLTLPQKGIVGGALICLLVMTGAIAYEMPRPARLADFVATARVTAPSTAMYASEDAAQKAILTLAGGEAVHILRLPPARTSEWVEVQYIKGRKAFRPAFVRGADLGDWSSDKPEPSLQLLKLYAPDETASNAEIHGQLERLASFLERFGISPQAPEANLDMALLNIRLARRAKDAGRPAEEWQPNLDAGAGELAIAKTNAGLAERAEEARKELDALVEPLVAPVPPFRLRLTPRKKANLARAKAPRAKGE